MSDAPERIQVVDDETVIVRSIRDFMTGYSVITTENSESAMAMVNDEFWDVIVTDYRMPKFNGLDILMTARAKGHYRYGILLTAFAEKQMLQEFLNKGLVRRVLEKPLDLPALKHAIDKALTICRVESRAEDDAGFYRSFRERFGSVVRSKDDWIVGIDGDLAPQFEEA